MPGSQTLEKAAQIPTQSVEPDIHVTSLVVYARPEAMSLVVAWLESLENVEIHAGEDEGKLIVVIESERAQTALDVIDASREQPGVIDAALVYHEIVSPEEEAS